MRLDTVRLPLAAALLCLCLPSALAQQMSKEDQAIYDAMIRKAGIDPALVHQAQQDNDDMGKWLSGKNGLVHYRIVGTYKGAPDVVGDNWIGIADVVDRVEIELDWKLDESRLVGTPSFRNFTSTVGKVRDPEGHCRPPTLNGPYEHFNLTGIRQGLSGALDLLSTTNFPAAQATQDCTGSSVAVPASVRRDTEYFVVLSPVLFAQARTGKSDVKVSADGKSLVTSKGGWTWTYTPSPR